MSALFILVLVSVGVAVFFLAVFIKAVKSGQYEDDYSPAVRILFENSSPSQTSEDKSIKKKNDEYGKHTNREV